MKILNKTLIATTLATFFATLVTTVQADDFRDFGNGFSSRDYITYDRQDAKRVQKWETERRQCPREMERENRKHPAEMASEQRKYEREMEREFRKGYRQRDRYGYEEIIWNRDYNGRESHRRSGLDELSVIIDILYRL